MAYKDNYLLIKGWEDQFDQEKIKIFDFYLYGLTNPKEAKVLVVSIQIGKFYKHIMNSFMGKTPLFDIELMEEEYTYADETHVQRQFLSTKHLYTLLNCRISHVEEQNNTNAQVLVFSYTSLVKITTALPKPALPNKKLVKTKFAK